MKRLLVFLLAGCATARPVPTQVPEPTALEATRCGDVVALWRGPASDGSMPLSYSVESLAFRCGDGVERAFSPSGTVAPPHRTLELFSPDCSWVALAQDSGGPYHLVPVAGLAAYLDGKKQPVVVKAPQAAVLTEGKWVGPARFEFFASCCGGVEVFAVDAAAPEKVERVYFAPEAPAGIRRTATGYEPVTSRRAP